MEELNANLSRYELEPQEAVDTEKAMDDLLFFGRTVITEMQNEEGL